MRRTLTAMSLMASLVSPAAALALGPFWGADPIVNACRSKISEARNRSSTVAYPVRNDVADLIARAEREEMAEDFKACHGFAELAVMQIERVERGEAGPQARVP